MTHSEQDIKLLNDILYRNYYYYFKKGEKSICFTFFNNNNYTNVQFIENFPVEENNTELILKNFQIFLDWYKENNFRCPIYIKDDLWLKDNDFKNNIFLYLKNFICNKINISITLEEIVKDLLFYKNLVLNFKKNNIDLFFSIETNEINIDNFIMIKSFLNEFNFKLKLQITPDNIEFLYSNFDKIFSILSNENLYLFEQDSSEWTYEKINTFILFIDKYIDYQNKNNNFFDFLINDENCSLISLKDTNIINNISAKGRCRFFESLNILVANNTINLCPKFQYDDQVIGIYEINNDKITSIKPVHLPLIILNTHLKRTSTPHCEFCDFVGLCKGCCCASSYLTCLEPIIPVMESCELKKAKYTYLIYKLNKLDFLNNIKDINIDPTYYFYIKSLFDNIIPNIKENK